LPNALAFYSGNHKKLKNQTKQNMGNVTIKVRQECGWDVIVAGGGPAGCAAAISAARSGAKVLLVEITTSLGGMGAGGLVPSWAPFSDGKRILYAGIATEVLRASGHPAPASNDTSWRPIDSEKLKTAYDRLLVDAGVTINFAQTLCAVETDHDNRVSSVILAGKCGLRALSASVFVDATGDADLATFAGCDVVSGDDTGELQPCTLCFTITGVNEDALRANEGWRSIGSLLQADPGCSEVPSPHCCISRIAPGVLGFNAGHIWDVDSTEPASYSSALLKGRRIAEAYLEGLVKHFPSTFCDAVLSRTGELLGVRETRRIVGDYILNMADYQARREFRDSIGRNCYPIDIHHTRSEAAAGNLQDVMERYEVYSPGESHGIPYRSLIPKGVENVLVAGRCVSTDRLVQGGIRVMPPCLVTGQAAGTAAALSLPCEGKVREVNARELRDALRCDGCVID
jgi:hypothetical protein